MVDAEKFMQMKRDIGGDIFKHIHNTNNNMNNNRIIRTPDRTPDRAFYHNNNYKNRNNVNMKSNQRTNTKYKRNLSEDRINTRNKRGNNNTSTSNSNNACSRDNSNSNINKSPTASYSRYGGNKSKPKYMHYCNKTPSPIRNRKNNDLSSSNISYSDNINHNFTTSNMNNSNINSSYYSNSNTSFTKYANTSQNSKPQRNSNMNKNNISHMKNRSPNSLNNYNLYSDINLKTSTHYEYSKPLSSGIGCMSNNSQHKERNTCYPKTVKPLFDNTNSFIEKNGKLYYNYLPSMNTNTCKETHSTNSNNTVNTVDDGKGSDTIEDVHFSCVFKIQSSKRVLLTTENTHDTTFSLHSTTSSHKNLTVIPIEEGELF